MTTVSIITPTYNSAKTLTDTLRSIENQSHADIEHILVDGLSSDQTVALFDSFQSRLTKRHLISEKDEGIYDAMNKGMRAATGDVVCVLNSDDFYADAGVIEAVVEKMKSTNADLIFADAVMVTDGLEVQRYWKGTRKPIFGHQVAHPSIWAKRSLLSAIDPVFDTSYSIAADLKFQLQLSQLKDVHTAYLKKLCVVIRLGGVSTSSAKAFWAGWVQSRRVFNDLYHFGGLAFTVIKVVRKIGDLITTKLTSPKMRASIEKYWEQSQ